MASAAARFVLRAPLSTTVPRGAIRLSFLRHAQGTHNEAEEEASRNRTYAEGNHVLLEKHTGLTYWDPKLTEKGVTQCKALRKSIRQQTHPQSSVWTRPDLVITSPLTRTCQTALLTLHGLGPASHPHCLPRSVHAPRSLATLYLPQTDTHPTHTCSAISLHGRGGRPRASEPLHL